MQVILMRNVIYIFDLLLVCCFNARFLWDFF